MKKIRLGVIGTGMAWERLHYPALSKMKERFEIVALCNRTKADAENFAKLINLDVSNVYDNYSQMLSRKDIDAIDIVVPIEQNYEVSESVARAGKHFICEKPLAPNLEQAQNFLQLSKRFDVKILIAENYRYNEENNKIKEIVSGGKIGEIIYFIRNNVFDFPKEMIKDTYAAKEWRQHPVFCGGVFLDGAVHDVAAMRHIFGEVELVCAIGKPQQADFSPFLSLNTNILFKNGVTGQYTYFPSGVESQKPLIGFRIFGTKGMIYLEEKSCGVINIFYNEGGIEQVNYKPEQGYYNEFMNFYHALNDTEEISVTPEIEFGDTKMIFDIIRSANNREFVYVDNESFNNIPYIENFQFDNQYVQ